MAGPPLDHRPGVQSANIDTIRPAFVRFYGCIPKTDCIGAGKIVGLFGRWSIRTIRLG
jgi:hypothetical protein